jgi:hypothetical protein
MKRKRISLKQAVESSILADDNFSVEELMHLKKRLKSLDKAAVDSNAFYHLWEKKRKPSKCSSCGETGHRKNSSRCKNKKKALLEEISAVQSILKRKKAETFKNVKPLNEKTASMNQSTASMDQST